MGTIVTVIGSIGFFACLFIMYATKHGIPGLRRYDVDFKLLDMQFRYNTEKVYSTFERIGAGGRAAYRNYLLLDFCFIACFLIVMFALTNRFAGNAALRNTLFALAALRAALDIAENSILLVLIHRLLEKQLALAELCSWVTTAKFCAMYLWLIGIVGVLVFRLFFK